MSALDAATAAHLLERARAAQARAYAPYSGFQVGAAALGASGRVYEGCNVENASFGLTVCAERVAVHGGVAAGERAFRAVAVVTSGAGPVAPCGACRQVLHEHGPDMTVVLPGPQLVALRELLPRSFGPDDLRAPRTAP